MKGRNWGWSNRQLPTLLSHSLLPWSFMSLRVAYGERSKEEVNDGDTSVARGNRRNWRRTTRALGFYLMVLRSVVTLYLTYLFTPVHLVVCRGSVLCVHLTPPYAFGSRTELEVKDGHKPRILGAQVVSRDGLIRGTEPRRIRTWGLSRASMRRVKRVEREGLDWQWTAEKGTERDWWTKWGV